MKKKKKPFSSKKIKFTALIIVIAIAASIIISFGFSGPKAQEKLQTPKETVEYTDEFTTIFSNGNEKTAVISSAPKNYADKNGVIRPIDINFKVNETTVDNKVYEISNEGIYSAYAKNGFKENEVVFDYKDRKVKYSIESLEGFEKNNTMAIVEGNTILYENAFDGVDVVYRYYTNVLKEEFVLNKKINSDFSIKQSFDYSGNIYINGNLWDGNKAETYGSISLGGKLIIQPAFAEDMHGKIIRAKYILEKNSMKIFIPENDLSLLSYPIVVDPSISVNLSGSIGKYLIGDVVVNQSSADTNYADAERLILRKAPGNATTKRAYFKWNLSSIAREAEEITSAKFELEKFGADSVTINLSLHEIFHPDIGFSPTAITYNSQPCSSSNSVFNSSCNNTFLDAQSIADTGGERINFTITKLVNESLSVKDANFGVFAFLLNASTGTTDDTNILFRASELGGNGEPQLYITYTINPPRVLFVSPTPANNSEIEPAGNYVYVNVSVSDASAGGNTSSFIDITSSNSDDYSLVGYWSFDNITKDNSTYGNNASGYSGVDCSPSALGKFSIACNFDGVNGQINISNSGSLDTIGGNFTLEAWINPVSNTNKVILNKTGYDVLIEDTLYPEHKYGIFLDANSKAQFQLKGTAAGIGKIFTVNSTSAIPTNTWTHIAGVLEDSRMLMYVNGKIEGNVSASVGFINTSTSTLNIGKSSSTSTVYNGLIDEVRIWKRALTDYEINASAVSGKLFRNFTSFANGNYKYYAYAVDEGGAFNKTGTMNFAVASVCGILNSSYTLQSDVSSQGTCFRLNQNNIKLDCAGYTINYATTVTGIGVDVNDKTNVNITNCVIKANNMNATNNYGIRLLRTNSSIALNNTIFTNGTSGTNAIRIDTNSNYNQVTNNIIGTNSNTTGIGISVQTSAVGNNLTGNRINTQGKTTTNYGIYLTSQVNNTYIANNIIATNGTEENYGIYLFTNVFKNNILNNTVYTNGTSSENYGLYLDTRASNNSVSNNTIFTNGTSSSVAIKIDTGSSYNAVDNNRVSSWGYGPVVGEDYGIQVVASSVNNNITNNIISTGHASSGNNYGIFLFTQTNNTYIANNIISTNGTFDNFGIYLFTDTYNNLALNNTIYTNGTSGTNYGIRLNTRSSNNTVQNNTIFTNGTNGNRGISIDVTSNYNTIDSNKISARGYGSVGLDYGISVVTSSVGNNITNNIISTGHNNIGSNFGIYLSSQVNNTYVANNIISTNGTNNNFGMYLFTNVYNNTILNNTIRTNGTAENNHGIFLSIDVANNSVINNTIFTNGTATNDGIRLTAVGTGSINTMDRNNITTFGGAASYGINILTSNFTVINNTIIDKPSAWISTGATTNNTFYNTTFVSLNGSINFLNSFYIDRGEIITITKLNVTHNRTYLNVTNLSWLNTSAIITLTGLTHTAPHAVFNSTDSYEGAGVFNVCPSTKCSRASYSGGTLVFSINSWTIFAAQNDTTGPDITVNSPLNITYNLSVVTLNYTASDNLALDQCIRELNGINTTIANCANQTLDESLLGEQSHKIIIWVNDSAGNKNYRIANFTFRHDLLLNNTLNRTGSVPQYNQSENVNISAVFKWDNTTTIQGASKNLTFRWNNSNGHTVREFNFTPLTAGNVWDNFTLNTSATPGIWWVTLTGFNATQNGTTPGRTVVNSTAFNVTDFVVPTVSIQSPPNATNSSSTVVLNYTASDNYQLSQCIREWTNQSGQAYNKTMTNCQNESWTASDGFHTIRMWVNDSSNNKAVAVVKFTIDTTPPQISIQNPLNITYNISVVRLNYTASDNLALDQCIRSLDNVNSTIVNCANQSMDESLLGEGSHVIIIWVNDSVNNVNQSNVSFTFRHVLLLNNSLNRTGYIPQYNQSENINISAVFKWDNTTTIQGASKNVTFRWNNSNGHTVREFNFTPLTAGNIWDNLTLNSSATPGIWWVTLTGFNATQNGTTPGRTVINSTAFNVTDFGIPLVSIQSPPNATNNTQIIVLNYTASDNLAIDQCIREWTNQSGQVYNKTMANCANDTWTASDGVHTIRMWVNDSSNNKAVASVTFTIDRTAPNITIQSPQNTTYNSSAVVLNYTAVDNLALDQCIREWTNQSGQVYNKTLANCANESFAANDGLHIIRMWVNDSAGNKNVSVANFTIDTLVPNITFVSPTPASGTGQNANYTYINVSVQDSNPTSSFIDITNSTGSYGLVEYLNLNNNTLDSSAYGNNATAGLPGINCGTDIAGKFGTACRFRGEGGGIKINYSSGNDFNESDFTAEAWVNPVSVSGVGEIFTRGYPSGFPSQYQFVLRRNGATWQFFIRNSSAASFIIQPGGVQANVWVHLAGVFNRTHVSLYVNGIFNKSVEFNGTIFNSTNPIIIGNTSGVGSGYFNGTIDEVKIWKRALSPEEINASANNMPLFRNFTDMSDGNYSFYAFAADTAGNTNRTETRWVIIDNVPPTVSIQSPPNATNRTQTIVLNYTAFDNYQLSQCIREWTNQSGQVYNKTMTSCVNESWTALDGFHTIRVWVNDTANNKAVASVSFTIDTVLPNITIQSPQNTTYNLSTVTLNYTAGDNLQLDTCIRSLDNVNSTIVNCANQSMDESLLGEGIHVIIIWVNDSANNVNQSNVSFTFRHVLLLNNSLNRTGYIPQYNQSESINISAVFKWDNLTTIQGASKNVTFRWNNSNGHTVREFNFTPLTAGNIWDNFTLNSSATPGIWWVTLTGFNATQNGTTPGRTIVNSTAFNVTDFVVPTVSIQSPPNATNRTSTIVLNYTAFDNYQLSQCIREWTNQSGQAYNKTMASCSNESWTASDGFHTISIWVNDTSNNKAVASVSFTIDTTPPQISIQNPLNITYNLSVVTLNYTTSDNLALDQCIRELNGINTTMSNCANQSMDESLLGEGAHVIIIWVNDSVNNVNQYNVSFTFRHDLLLNNSLNRTGYIPQYNQSENINISAVFKWDNTTTIQGASKNVTFRWNNSNGHTVREFNFTPLTAGNVWDNLTLNSSATPGIWWVTLTGFNATQNGTTPGRTIVNSTAFNVTDFVVPTVSIQSPQNTTYNLSTVTLNYTADDNLQLDTCIREWTNQSGQAYNKTMTNCQNESWTASDGFHTIRMWVNDSSNNKAVASVSFTIDRTAPSITIQNPQNTTYNSSVVTLNYTAVDNLAISQCIREWTNQSGQVYNKTLTNCANDSWTASDGFHIIRMWVNDSAGNKNVSVSNFTIDTLVPNIAFVSPTPASGTGQTANYTYINVSVNDTNPTSSFIDWNRTLLGYWNLNNNTLDSSTYGNNATAMSVSCSPSDPGKFGSACLFGAAQNYGIVIPYTTQNSLNESAFTVEAWSMRKGTSPSTQIIVTRAGLFTTEQFELSYLTAVGWRFYVRNSTSAMHILNSGEGTPAINVWRHIAGVYNGTHIMLYIDGALNSTLKVNGTLLNSSKQFTIGNATSGLNQWFNGTIDEVKIWKRALSPEEINASANSMPLFRNFTSLQDGNYSFYAFAADTAGNTNRTETRTLLIDTTPPSVTLVHPLNITYNETETISVNYTLVEINKDTCRMELDGVNSTLGGCANTTLGDLYAGSHNIVIWVNDSVGYVDHSSRLYFSVDVALPQLLYVPPTEDDGAFLPRNWIFVNITSDVNLTWALLEVNGVNYTMQSMNVNNRSWSYNLTADDGEYYFIVRGNWTKNTTKSVIGITGKRFVSIDARNRVSFKWSFSINAPANDDTTVENKGIGYYTRANLTKPYACTEDRSINGIPTIAMIYAGGQLNFINHTSANTSEMSQMHAGNRYILAITQAGCNETVAPKVPLPLNVAPFVPTGETKDSIELVLRYPNIDIVGNFERTGDFTLILEKNETENKIAVRGV